MSDDAECEFARSGHDARTVSGGDGPVESRRRVLLRASDGVRIEAAYDPYTGRGHGAGPHRIRGGEPDGDPEPEPGGVQEREPGPGHRPETEPGRGRSPEREPRGRPYAPGAIVLAHGFTGSVDRPALRRAARVLTRYGAVVTFSFRGHGRSGGRSTVGDLEVLDLAAAVRWARSLGHERVATVGFSMGGSVVVRHGALRRPGHGRGRSGPPQGHPPGEHSDAVVAVSAPARWYYRGTAPMRRLHWVVQRPLGRLVSRYGLRTRIHPRDWDPVPLSPVAAAPLLAPTPLLVVHGDRDPYFPVDHPESLAAAGDPDFTELWLVEGFGHAENAADDALLHRVGRWVGDRWSDRWTGPSPGPA